MTNDPDQRLMTNDQRLMTNDQRLTTVGRFLLRRLLLTIPVLLGVATLVFSLIHLVPGSLCSDRVWTTCCLRFPNSKFLLPNSDPAGEGEERRVLRVLFQAARDGDLCGVATAGAQLRIGERREQPQIAWTRRGGPPEPVGGGRPVVYAARGRRRD